MLITGASTGIGRATADRVAAAGATVIGTSRYPWRYPQPPNWSLFQMDQTQDDSVKQLISRYCLLCMMLIPLRKVHMISSCLQSAW